MEAFLRVVVSIPDLVRASVVEPARSILSSSPTSATTWVRESGETGHVDGSRTRRGVRWLTDPALSPPGEYGALTKLTGPALDITEHGPIDVVLLSHHHHSDNLDPAGKAFLPSAKRVLSTTKAAEELGGNVVGMDPWSEVEIESPRGGIVKVTASSNRGLKTAELRCVLQRAPKLRPSPPT